MPSPAALLERLEAIGASVSARRHTLALLGLGSVGRDLNRLDELSDLDFFLIVESGYQQEFIEDLSWLSDVAEIAFSFQNTRHGHKVLFEDRIYAEFAVFAPEELAKIPAERGRVIWAAELFDESVLEGLLPGQTDRRGPEWLVGEILTNLFVGLLRFRRGERLAGFRLVQVHAVDRLLELAAVREEPAGTADSFDPTRRFELRFPQTAKSLSPFMQGYERTPESAIAILEFLKPRFAIDAALENRIRAAADECRQQA